MLNRMDVVERGILSRVANVTGGWGVVGDGGGVVGITGTLWVF
jgi:hypothetical protein